MGGVGGRTMCPSGAGRTLRCEQRYRRALHEVLGVAAWLDWRPARALAACLACRPPRWSRAGGVRTKGPLAHWAVVAGRGGRPDGGADGKVARREPRAWTGSRGWVPRKLRTWGCSRDYCCRCSLRRPMCPIVQPRVLRPGPWECLGFGPSRAGAVGPSRQVEGPAEGAVPGRWPGCRWTRAWCGLLETWMRWTPN